MRYAFGLVGLSALGGCALLVDLNDLSSDAGLDSSAPDAASDATLDAAPDATADAAIQDSGPCADGGAAVVESVTPSNADTIIVQPSPTLNWGPSTTANVSDTIKSAGLVRFTVSATAVTAFNAGRVVNVDVTLTRVMNDPACNGACPAAAGTFTINPLTTNWIGGDGKTGSGASWNTNNGSAAWAVPGALGIGTDIAASDASVTFDGLALLLTFTLPGSAFAGFVASSQLAVGVGPSGGAVFVVATKENTLYAKPVVKITYCP